MRVAVWRSILGHIVPFIGGSHTHAPVPDSHAQHAVCGVPMIMCRCQGYPLLYVDAQEGFSTTLWSSCVCASQRRCQTWPIQPLRQRPASHRCHAFQDAIDIVEHLMRAHVIHARIDVMQAYTTDGCDTCRASWQPLNAISASSSSSSMPTQASPIPSPQTHL